MTGPIDYAPPLPWYRRPQLRRAAIWLLILAALALASYYFGPPIYRRCMLLYWQSKCMNYAAPPNSLVCTTDTLNSPALRPSEIDSLRQYAADDVAEDLDLDQHYPIVFLHARTCAAGERLVIVRIGAVGVGQVHNYIFALAVPQFTIIKPGTLTTPPEITCESTVNPFTIGGSIPKTGEKFFAGSPDPADPARILIHFEIEGIRSQQAFRLNAAGNNLEKE